MKKFPKWWVLTALVLGIFYLNFFVMAGGGTTTVAEAAGSHSSHHVKIIGHRFIDTLESEANKWIEKMNSNKDFNIISIEYEVSGDALMSNSVMIWYEV